MIRAAFPLLLIALAGCAGGTNAREEREQAGLAQDLATRTAGAPQSCAPISAQSQNVRAIDRRTLVFEQGSTIWVNRLPADCPGLDNDSILIFETFGGSYCRGDRLRAQERGTRIPGPWCPLGEWTAYRQER